MRFGGPQSWFRREEEKNSWPYRVLNSDLWVGQPVASHYADCAILPPNTYILSLKIKFSFFPLQLLETWEHARLMTESEALRPVFLLDLVVKYDWQFADMFSCLLLIHFLICMK
jgi:hypothetical protein